MNGENAIPKVTVITATYNRPHWLKDALASAVRQSFRDWEMLVINDGGRDVGGIVSSFGDPRLVYVDMPKNRGKPACLNAGLRSAKGDYIAYLDDDDVWYPDHLATLVDALDRNPDKGLAYTCLHTVLAVSDPNTGKRYPLDRFVQAARPFNRDFLFFGNPAGGVCMMHRRDVALKAGGFDENVTVMDDWNITRKIAFFTDFVFIPKITGALYMQPLKGSDRNSDVGRKDPEAYNRNVRKIKADLPSEPWPRVEKIDVVFPIKASVENVKDALTRLMDSVFYPVRYILVNCNGDNDEQAFIDGMGDLGALKNVSACTPDRPASKWDAYRFGAEQSGADWVYLPTARTDTSIQGRLISAMHFLQRQMRTASGGTSLRNRKVISTF